jgi:uncharacterized membrane protein
MNQIINIVITIVLFIIVDLIYFSFTMKTIYDPVFLSIQKEQMNITQSKQRVSILIWIFLVIGIYVFVLPQVTSNLDALKYGALYGLIVYGIYNITNYLLLNNYTSNIVLIDILWGVTICSVFTLFSYYLTNK